MIDLRKSSSFQDAPDKGVMLAYTRSKVELTDYDGKDEVLARLENEDLLEIHLFDSTKEYRAMSSESNRYAEKGFVEAVEDFVLEESGYDYYFEDMQLEEKIQDEAEQLKGVITVVNRINYDEKGMAYVDTYRMMIKE